jgi:hypothetical protein
MRGKNHIHKIHKNGTSVVTAGTTTHIHTYTHTHICAFELSKQPTRLLLSFHFPCCCYACIHDVHVHTVTVTATVTPSLSLLLLYIHIQYAHIYLDRDHNRDRAPNLAGKIRRSTYIALREWEGLQQWCACIWRGSMGTI